MSDISEISDLSHVSPDSSISRKLKDTGAGFVGGAVQVLVGQPFDLIKVRLQTGQYNSTINAFTQTLKNEGVSAFYKGTTAPLFGVGACVSIQFYAFHEVKRQLLSYNQRKQTSSPSSLTLPQFYIAGASAGVVNSLIASPVEHLRILIQTQKDARYSGPFDAAKKIHKSHGISGLYRGFNITLLREFQAYGIWFLTFEYLMSREIARNKISRDDIPTWKLMTFGALAGEALWLASYPLDVIKSQVQGHPFGTRLTAIEAAKRTFATQGIRGFWRGIIPTLLRAIPASASTFASVELTLRLLG